MDGNPSPTTETKSVAEWIESTVRPADTTIGRTGWSASPLTKYAERYRQYVVICAGLNASNVAAVPLRLYANGQSRRRRDGKRVKVEKRSRKRWLSDPRGVGTKASQYAAYADDDVYEVVDHPVLDIVNRPNAWMSGPMMVEWVASSLELFGNSFLYATSERDKGKPDTLLPLMSHYTRVAADSSSFVRGYWYGRNQMSPVLIPSELVGHFKHRPNPLDPYYGLSPLAAALVEADLANQATVAEWYRWQNGGRPDYSVEVPGPLSDDQKKQLSNEIKAYTHGPSKSGNFLITTGAKIVPLGFAPKDMEYLAGLTRADEVVWNAYGVPQSLVKLNDANLASSESGHVQYYKLTINPRCARIAEVFTDWLLPLLGVDPGSMWFAFDDASHESEQAEMAAMTAMANAGVLTIDEVRAEQGLPPLPNGAGEVPRFNGTPLDKMGQSSDPLAGLFRGQGGADDAPNGEDDGAEASSADSADETSEAPDGEDDAENAIEQNKSKSLHVVSIPAGLKFYGHLNHGGITSKDKDKEPYHADANINKLGAKLYAELVEYYKRAAGMILDDGGRSDLGVNDADLMAIVDRNIRELLRAGALQGYNTGGSTLENGELPQMTVAQVNRLANTYVPRLAQSISDDLSHSLKSSLVEAVANGMTYPEAAAQVRELIPELADWRAERIARTETSSMIGQGEIASWKDIGIEGKEWLLGGNSCQFCVELAAANPKPIPIDQPFARVGETFDGTMVTWADITTQPAHPNCTCRVVAAISLDDEDSTDD